MENEKEITKLVNVLRQIRNAGRFPLWQRDDSESMEFCLQQYNKIVVRLGELEPSVNTLFTTLPDNASPKTLHFAVSELAAYLTDEKETEESNFKHRHRHPHHHRWGCGRKRWDFSFSPFVDRF